MSQNEVKSAIEEVLDNSHVGIMATVQGNKPHSRYMTFFHKDLKLYTATSSETHKVAEMEKNPFTHIILGYEGDGYGDEYVEYEGQVSISDSEELKKELWTDQMKPWFDGPEDPDLVILEISPIQIRLMNKKNESPKILEIS